MGKVKTKTKTKVKAKGKSKSNVKQPSKKKTRVKSKTKTKVKTKVSVKVKPFPKVKSKKPTTVSSKAKAKVNFTTKIQKEKPFFNDVFVPLDDRVLVRPLIKPARTSGGLYIPDTVEGGSSYPHAQVVSVGRGHLSKKGQIVPMDVQLGDEIVFMEHSGSSLELCGETLMILRESDIMGVVV